MVSGTSAVPRKTAGIIAEYNPFHNGHAYQIQEVRRRSGADFILVIMSGDFVQRGAPALLDKYVRTRMALQGGADLVLELPCAAASGSAARFAGEAVRILDRLQVVQELWFGSEAGVAAPLMELAEILAQESSAYCRTLHFFLKQGRSYPLARQEALKTCLAGSPFDGELEQLLNAPNNILGIEYCLALKQLGSSILPRTLKRAGSSYHETKLEDLFSSASAIRQAVKQGVLENLQRQMPLDVYETFSQAEKNEGFLEEDDFSLLLQCRLLTCGTEDLFPYMPESTARRIVNLRNQFRSFSQFSDLLKTRERTRSSINRYLLHALLDIPSNTRNHQDSSFSGALSCPTLTDGGMARILGFRRQAASLLTAVKQAGGLSLEARPGALPPELYARDLRASNLYEAVRAQKTGQVFREERTRQPVVL